MIAQPSRWEFLLEKATELGVTAIQPITSASARNAIALTASVPSVFYEQRSSKQNGRGYQSYANSSFAEALSEAAKEGRKVILLHEAASSASCISRSMISGEESLSIIVGPEGGFSDSEVEMASRAGAEIVSLGLRRLRAETAALAALALLIDQ